MILVLDHMFPSKYAKWRIEGLKAMVDAGADILVSKVSTFANINFDVDYEEMKEYYGLQNYNILIFDPQYNYLNKYNNNFDGTKFNKFSTIKYSYMFTKGKIFDLNQYKQIYHMFLSSYKKFNDIFAIPRDKQIIHLYPGGSFNNSSDLNRIDKHTKVISTHPHVSRMLKDHGHKFIECFGSTCLPKDHVIKHKKINTDKVLRICFSNMGDTIYKGVNIFFEIMGQCNSVKNLEWHFVGSTFRLPKNPPKNLIYHKPMSQTDLDKFYYEKIDILINAENGTQFNGWPLGVEAALQGVVLCTTDSFDANSYFKYTPNMMMISQPISIRRIAQFIARVQSDRKLLHDMSIAIQEHTTNHFSYENQQKKILEYINEK